jgi:negative regulator of flagellin synthesis FlgM
MPPIDTRLTSPIGRIDAVSLNPQAVRLGSGASGKAAKPETADPAKGSGVVLGDTLDAGAVPVDTDRVNQIRKALEAGTYPILPTSVADAIIAAGLILRTAK